jgi:Multiubiquitin
MNADESYNLNDQSGTLHEGRATPKPFEIIVNSRSREVEAQQVTFEQVVQLAFPGPHETNVVFSMTYRHAASTPHAGELGAGGNIEVKKKGTVFNVTRTVQS